MRLIPREGYLRRQWEAWLVLMAAWLLRERNVPRAGVVSRRDNNDMFYMADQLESIADRIRDGYRK